MHGKIISKAGNYGFIHCAKGVAHYFDNRLLGEGVGFDDLEIGTPVHFEPVAGPKGMRAKRVSPREVLYGWTTGPFLVLRGNEAIPERDSNEVEPPCNEHERFTTMWANFTIPFHGDVDPVKSRLIEQAKEAGANAIDMLKVDQRINDDGESVGKYRVLTGRIAFYHGSVEIESDEQYLDLLNEHNALYAEVHPKILALQEQLVAQEDSFQIHFSSVIGDSFMILRQGESFHEGKTQLRGVPLTSTWSRDANAGKQELLRLVEVAGGNCISELTRIEHTRSKGNYNYTMFAWVGCAGVWARMRQVSDLEDAERLRIDEANEEFCETVHARMIETQRVLDQNRKSEARMYLFWKIGFPVLVVVVVLLILKTIS